VYTDQGVGHGRSCASLGDQGNFIVGISRTGSTDSSGNSELGVGGHDCTYERGAGIYYLSVDSAGGTPSRRLEVSP
jgi:hypothetical protein